MKLKNSFFLTYKENVKDEDSVSSNLLVRAGMIKKSSSGVYIIMPLGYKVLTKIENIIRTKMNEASSQELLMPSLIHEDIYKTTNRLDTFGNSVFSLTDRANKKYILGPTHEELFASLAVNKVNSYKDLPFSLYQFQTKFRDEARPRYGLIRVREFIMKDAYSFDTDLEGLDISYNKMDKAYQDIFNTLELDYRKVKADTGAMGGLLSEEFQAITSIGEDTLVVCDKCNYASNIEIASTTFNEVTSANCTIEKINTPNIKTITDIKKFFNNEGNFVKSVIYNIDSKLVLVMIDGNYEVNLTKLSKIYSTENITLATNEEIEKLNTKLGYIGPIDIEVEILVDKSVLAFDKFICGANEEDYHLKNVTLNDINKYQVVDIHTVNEGDDCPICKGKLEFSKGIEVGNLFKLGTKYSKAFNLEYVTKDNKKLPVVMGSYGIGVGRVMASVVEQHNDNDGIIFPKSIAPYDTAIVVANTKDELQLSKAEELYIKYINNGVDVVLDDRDESFGTKMKDMTLIGIPKIIIIGKNIVDNNVEVKLRTSTNKDVIAYEEL